MPPQITCASVLPDRTGNKALSDFLLSQ